MSPHADGVPWEEVRALVWELRRTHELMHDATTPREWEGERFLTGCTHSLLITAIDLGGIVDKLVSEIGFAREKRLADFVGGLPVARFGQVEQTQLKADVRRLEELAINGGYGFMFSRAAR